MNTCPKCGGRLYLHGQSPHPVYFCAEDTCNFRIDARDIDTLRKSREPEPVPTNSAPLVFQGRKVWVRRGKVRW